MKKQWAPSALFVISKENVILFAGCNSYFTAMARSGGGGTAAAATTA
jgi:hypothetical protein